MATDEGEGMHTGSDDTVELHIPNAFGSEKVAMEAAASVARQVGFSRDRIEDLKTAVSEACLNAIEHGNRMDASVRVGIRLVAGASQLQVTVRDQGEGFGPVPQPDIDAKIAGREPARGWGIFLIKNLVNEVQFATRAGGGGNEIRMLIHLERDSGTPGGRCGAGAA
jgi:serine/threonine-protein kinase RsbW